MIRFHGTSARKNISRGFVRIILCPHHIVLDDFQMSIVKFCCVESMKSEL